MKRGTVPNQPQPKEGGPKRGRPPTRPTPPGTTCAICLHWRQAKWASEMVKTCPHHKTPISRLDNACPRFELARIFFCREIGQVFAVACAHRYKKCMEDCGACDTGRVVRKIMHQREAK